MIKASVSRQREYLADASAVQYTRNPSGIANALKRIGADSQGSVLKNPAASEISHALFSNGLKSSITSVFATHPPLKKRIQSIEPGWDGSFELPPPDHQRRGTTAGPAASSDEPEARDKRRDLALIAGLGVLAERAMAQAGEPETEHLRYAEQLHRSLPDALLTAAHDPYAARALIYRLALAADKQTQQSQLDYLAENADTGVHDQVLALQPHCEELQPEHRLPLINIALSGMRQMSAQQYRLFRGNLAAVLQRDKARDVQHWVVHKIVTHYLDQVFPDPQWRRERGALTLQKVPADCAVLLSWLLYAGEHEAEKRSEVFAAATVSLALPEMQLQAAEQLSLRELDQAVDRLARLRPLLKPQLLKACADCIAADGQASVRERELFRAVAEIIDCPMPPLLS